MRLAFAHTSVSAYSAHLACPRRGPTRGRRKDATYGAALQQACPTTPVGGCLRTPSRGMVGRRPTTGGGWFDGTGVASWDGTKCNEPKGRKGRTDGQDSQAEKRGEGSKRPPPNRGDSPIDGLRRRGSGVGGEERGPVRGWVAGQEKGAQHELSRVAPDRTRRGSGPKSTVPHEDATFGSGLDASLRKQKGDYARNTKRAKRRQAGSVDRVRRPSLAEHRNGRQPTADLVHGEADPDGSRMAEA